MAPSGNTKKNSSNDMEEDDSKTFPMKLMQILADERYSEAICWLPHGKAFVIRNRELFAETVMPNYFSRKAKYSSFTRKLNRWNFSRVASGPEIGAYYHEHFLREKPHLAAQMFCKNARTKLAMANDTPAPAGSSQLAAPQQRVEPPVAAASAKNGMPATLPPGLAAFLSKDPEEYHGAYAASGAGAFSGCSSSSNGNSSLQLLEQQMRLLQEEQAQRRLLMQRFAAANSFRPIPEQQQSANLIRLRQIMEMRARQRQGLAPTNHRASAA